MDGHIYKCSHKSSVLFEIVSFAPFIWEHKKLVFTELKSETTIESFVHTFPNLLYMLGIKKVKVFPVLNYVIKHYAMKAYGAVLHTRSTFA
jgi:hypothetical protein